MAVYQDKAKERIKKQIPKIRGIVERGIELKTKEADTRQMVIRILVDMLGWSEFEQVTGEYAIKGGFADYMLQKDGNVFAVIEVKPVSVNLNENHMRQARDYAFNEGIEWVILTNANEWRLYRTRFLKNAAPDIVHIYTVKITDPNMKPAVKSELLYLLSEEAFRKAELKEYCDRFTALSGISLATRLLGKDALDRVRISLKKETGHTFSNKEIAEAIVERVIADEAMPENVCTLLKKV